MRQTKNNAANIVSRHPSAAIREDTAILVLVLLLVTVGDDSTNTKHGEYQVPLCP